MMGEMKLQPRYQWNVLTQALPEAQREQLAAILLSRIRAGWGEVTITVKDGHLKEFREVATIPAARPEPPPLIEYK